MEYLSRSQDQLASLCTPLSAEQAETTPGEERWSINGHVEHLAQVERGILVLLRRKLGAEATQEELAQCAGKEELIWARVPQPAARVQAPENVVPQGRFGSWPRAWQAFAEARQATLAFAAQTPAAQLRSFVHPHAALGALNGEQWLLFLAAHTERHGAHIRGLLDLFADLFANPD
ncbi:MAG: hypothetical protein OHK0021_05280 [Bryobacter sp.]